MVIFRDRLEFYEGKIVEEKAGFRKAETGFRKAAVGCGPRANILRALFLETCIPCIIFCPFGSGTFLIELC